MEEAHVRTEARRAALEHLADLLHEPWTTSEELARIEEEIRLAHQDGYMFTAIPVVACLLQYLDGTARESGLWTQANLVEPQRLLRDLQRMGVEANQAIHLV